jgi:hypothetical protein
VNTTACTSAAHAGDIDMYGCCDACGTWAWDAPRPARRIVCASGHGQCPGWHETAEAVRRCYVAAGRIDGLWTCGWQFEGAIATGDPDEPYYRGILECDAPARERADGSGYDCEAGHEHTYAEARQAQGWDYADEDEAAGLAKAGVEPRTMTGQVWPW